MKRRFRLRAAGRVRAFNGRLSMAALVCVLSLAAGASAWAQQPAKLPKVAVLSPRAPTAEACGANRQGTTLPCFLQAMRDLGYVEGRNVSFEFRYANDDFKRLPALAGELVKLRPDVIYTFSSPGLTAAADATSTIPIIVGPAGEILLTRLAGNLARPTRNVTGFTLVSVEQEIKCLELLKELAPHTARVALLINPDNPVDRESPGALAPAAAQLGMSLVTISARDATGLPQAFAAIEAARADAIFDLDDAVLAGNAAVRKQISEWALPRKVAVASPNVLFAADGGLLSFGTDLNALARRAAGYVDKVLKGARPAVLPVERPSKYMLSVQSIRAPWRSCCVRMR